MKNLVFNLLFISTALLVFGQIQKSVPFDLKGPVDADYMDHSFWIGNDICTISRIQGKQNRTSSYAVVRYNEYLTQVWRSSVSISENEDLLSFFELDNSVFVLINGYNPETKKAYITRAEIFKQTGDWLKTDTVISETIKPWLSRESKATVKQTFQNAILSIQYKDYVVPLEYRYNVEISPDSSKLMIFRYDYGQKNLWVKAKVYDRKFNIFEEGEVPVDDHYICYGMGVNNDAEVILYKANEVGKVVTVRFHLATEDFKYVSLYTANSTRDNLTLWQQDLDHLFVAKLNRKNESFVGVTFSRFNFLKEKVDDTRFQAFESTFKDELIKQMKKERIPNLDDNWYHYELTDFFIDNDSNRIILVEERNIISTDFEYEPEAVERQDGWIPKIGRIKAGALIMFVFDKDNKFIYKYGLVKNQDIDATDGLNTISYTANHLSEEGILQLVMAEEGGSTTLNQIRFMELDYVRGEVKKDYKLNNPEKLVMIRPFTLFKDGHMYFVGKKGVFGKKSFFVKYKL